ncbi:MAG TPA: S41 family peptidase [Vicinamibacterales bacterium]|nr:S41 family peptidase [Vicinamibacterales bacterium]
MNTKGRLVAILVSAPVIAFTIVGGFLGHAIARTDDTYANLRVFQDVITLVMNNYVEQPNVESVMRGAMRGLAEGLDSDSAYLTPQQVRQVESGEQTGAADVGIVLTHQYYLRVVSSRDDSPAAKAGVRPGDFVRVIDSRPTRDMSAFEGQRLLAGAAGSKVKLTVIRGGSTADPHVIELTREMPPAVDVKGRVQEDGVGYVRVAGFGRRTVDQLRSQITTLTKAGATRLILDVRNVAAGDLAEGVAAARLFVGSGTLAIRESRATGQAKIEANKGDGSIALPVTLLVDSGTSGPAEIFAAALSGNKRAELIGERTLGRSGVQELVKLPDGSALWITSARYLTPAGTPLQAKGLEPDVAVDQPEADFGAPAPADAILQRAVERLTKKKAA